MGEYDIMLNSKDYESFIESHAESVMFTLKSQLLSSEEKDLIKKALFLFQKDTYEHIGKSVSYTHLTLPTKRIV